MNAEDYLNQLQRMDMQIQHLTDQIEMLKTKATKVNHAFEGDKVQGSRALDPMGEAVIAYVDKQRELEELVRKDLKIRGEIISMIESLQDHMQEAVIYDRYVKYMTISETAMDQGISFSWVKVCTKLGLQEIQKKLDAVTKSSQ